MRFTLNSVGGAGAALLALTLGWVVLLGVTPTGAGGAQSVRSDALPPDTLLVLQRGACEHRCAVYNAIVFADGSAIFDGRHYVRRPGVAKTVVGREMIRAILDAATAKGFFRLRDRYEPDQPDGCPAASSDGPTATLTIGAAGLSKTVVHYVGCSSPESSMLAELESMIDRAINSTRWVK